LHDLKVEGPIRRTREGGSEWEPIKILLEGDENSNKTNMASKSRLRLNYPSWLRPRSHWSATGPRSQQPPSRTRERSGTPSLAPLTHTGHIGEQHRSDRSLLAKPGNFHRRPLHRSGWCSSPVRPVQVRKLRIHQTGLPSSKLTQTRNSSNTGNNELTQTFTRGKSHKALHRSDR
jgi:hypothetical protein